MSSATTNSFESGFEPKGDCGITEQQKESLRILAESDFRSSEVAQGILSLIQ